MQILWKYFKQQKWLVVLSLFLASVSQLLNLTDPIIFGKIIDDYAMKSGTLTQKELINGVLYSLGIAIAITVAARIAKAFQEYFTRQAVQQFGMQIFNDGPFTKDPL